jgi:hypothetical protein
MDKLQVKFYNLIENSDIVEVILKKDISQSRMRSLLFNLRKFPHLVEDLLNGKLDPGYFAKDMTHDEMLLVKRESVTEKFIDDTRDGIEKCNNCNSMRTECTEIHTLEYTLIRVYCKDCGHTNKI